MCGTGGWIGRQEGGEEVANRSYEASAFPSAEITKPLSRC